MTSENQAFQREVLRIDNPAVVAGNMSGHRARRLIDGSETAFTDPFLLMAEDWMPHGAFSRHPHRGMETVTFIIEGVVEHFDTAGHSGLLKAGDAQWMTAGRGVQHEENVPDGTIAHTAQLWVNLPASAKMTEPSYQDLIGDKMLVRREPGVEARVFSGRSADAVSTTVNHVPVTMLDIRLDPDALFLQELPATDTTFLFVLEGRVAIGAGGKVVNAGEIAWLTRAETGAGSELLFAGTAVSTRVLLFSGKPLYEPVVFGGPFVMNSQEEIQEAFADYRAGRM